MKDITLHGIREEFLKYFERKEHIILPSFPLVPKDDKSLLLINAGMAPLKPYFVGEKTPPGKRVVTCQKCIRTGDIENVGKTSRHATFFEMLGNFSFGDYFKKEAIAWAWEFITVNMGIPKDLLWVSIYLDDDEAYDIWNKDIGIDKSRIVRLGKEDNFWELEIGPCGPCSEIYVDKGQKYGCGNEGCKPGCDCDRYIEVWNLVFTQFNKDENGVYHPLEHPNIDTGMGLERIAAVMQDVDSIFEVKEIKEILEKCGAGIREKYGTSPEDDLSIRVITDHARAITFMISDGVFPSNEGRGYVLRRLIRRAARHGKLLGIKGIFLNRIIEVVIESWKIEYMEIKEREEQIKKVIMAEEKKFQETIHQGIQILDEFIDIVFKEKKTYLDGEKAFKLYDTYGFPLDLTKEILNERGLTVDESDFNRKMEDQRNRARMAREATDWGWEDASNLHLIEGYDTLFRGYDKLDVKTEIVGIYANDKMVNSIGEGEEGIIVLKETPFYAESGGQIGDKGHITGKGFTGRIVDTQYTKDNSIMHFVIIEKGIVNIGDNVWASVDGKSRKDTIKNHSATHLLHRALKEVLGDHVNQAGSEVTPNRLRFDFTHYEKVKEEDLKRIEEIVNDKIGDFLRVSTKEVSLKESQDMGVVGLFEGKYKDYVRVVQIGDYSKELCGGTHVGNSGDIGIFKIISESSIASGTRRIEGITGRAVYEYLGKLEKDMDFLTCILKTNRESLTSRIESIMEELKEKEKIIESYKSKMARSIVDKVLDSGREINGINIITYRVENMGIDGLRDLGDELKIAVDSSVIVLTSVDKGKLYFVSIVTKDLVEKGIHAGLIVKEVAKITGGGGGGRPDMAQAGGKDLKKIEIALNAVPEIISKQIK